MKKLSLLCAMLVMVFASDALAQTSQSENTTQSARVDVPLDSQVVIDPSSPPVGYIGKDIHPHVLSDGGIGFKFPRSPQPDPNNTGLHYGYVVRPWTQSISGHGLTMVIRLFVKSGDPIFNSDDPRYNCYAPAKVRFFVQRGSVMYGGDEWSRLWSNPVSFDLSDGINALNGQEITITVQLDPGQWSDVSGHFGDSNPGAFWQTMNGPGWIGVTFGGCFFGHGVNVSYGKVSFQLLQYYYQ